LKNIYIILRMLLNPRAWNTSVKWGWR